MDEIQREPNVCPMCGRLQQTQEDAVWKVAGDWLALKAERDALREQLDEAVAEALRAGEAEMALEAQADEMRDWLSEYAKSEAERQPCCGNRDCGHRESGERELCPTHNMPDCSPLLNGCSYFTAPTDADVQGQLVTLMGYPVGYVQGTVDWSLEQIEVLVQALREEAEHAAEVPFRSMQADLENIRQQRDLAEQELAALHTQVDVMQAQLGETRAERDAAMREMANRQRELDEVREGHAECERNMDAALADAVAEATYWRKLWKQAAMGVLTECPTCGRETRSQTTPDGRHRYFTCADPWHEQLDHMGAGTGPGHVCGTWCLAEGDPSND